MKRLICPLFIFSLLAICCNKAAQDQGKTSTVENLNYSKAWGKAFGGTDVETTSSIISTTDGGYVLIGRTYSNNGDITNFHGLIDIWVVKVDAGGNMVWQKAIGGSLDDYGMSIAQNPDGSILGTGFTKSIDGDLAGNNGNTDAVLFKLDQDGNLLWLKNFGGTGADYAASIVRNSDGTFLISGSSSNDSGAGDSDAWVYKADANGTMIWQKKYGGTGDDQFNCLIKTVDGGYIMGGTTTSTDGDISGYHGGVGDSWVVKIDPNGNKIWAKTLGGSGSESPTGIIQTTDGNYILTGKTISNDGDMIGNHGSIDGYIIKLNSNGNLVWQKTIGGSNTDWAQSIIQSNDGGYLIGASSKSNDGDFLSNLGFQDAWIVKIDADANIMGKQIVGGSAHDEIAALTKNADGSFAFAGASQSVDGDISGHHGTILTDLWLLKFTDQ